ncbi:MAG: SDR family oxidoreductase [Alphaproteobacteria bacterium]|nr:SDR family oxidoreductase [Alphaproteobacteria bacterium]
MAGILVVTGGSRGIGRAVAMLGAARGYAVAVNYAEHAKHAGAVVDAIRAKGGKAIAVGADVSKEADVERMFKTVDQELGRLTALVNNAGIGPGFGRVDEISAADAQRTLDVNVMGVFLCTKAAMRRMAKRHGGQGGAIVNVGSAAAKIGGPAAFVHYAASKGAVDSMTVGLGKEAIVDGVRVNCVRPGVTDTDMLRGGPDTPVPKGSDEWLAGVLKTLPIGRLAFPEELAESILWLLSDQASYVTGAILDVSGGRATP